MTGFSLSPGVSRLPPGAPTELAATTGTGVRSSMFHPCQLRNMKDLTPVHS